MNYEELVALAEAVVAERGADFVYNTDGKALCAYVPSTDPRFPFLPGNTPASGGAVTGCIVGAMIERAGKMTDALASFRGTAQAPLIREALGIGPYSKEVTFLSNLQADQDGGVSWGEALENAKLAVENQ